MSKMIYSIGSEAERSVHIPKLPERKDAFLYFIFHTLAVCVCFPLDGTDLMIFSETGSENSNYSSRCRSNGATINRSEVVLIRPRCS